MHNLLTVVGVVPKLGVLGGIKISLVPIIFFFSAANLGWNLDRFTNWSSEPASKVPWTNRPYRGWEHVYHVRLDLPWL